MTDYNYVQSGYLYTLLEQLKYRLIPIHSGGLSVGAAVPGQFQATVPVSAKPRAFALFSWTSGVFD